MFFVQRTAARVVFVNMYSPGAIRVVCEVSNAIWYLGVTIMLLFDFVGTQERHDPPNICMDVFQLVQQ